MAVGLLLGSVGSQSLARADTAQPDVSIGDVYVSAEVCRSTSASRELVARALRSALDEELTRLAELGPLPQRLTLSASLTRLTSQEHAERTAASATISIALTRADDRQLLAELRGNARVEESHGSVSSSRWAALQGAARSALAGLPRALQRTR